MKLILSAAATSDLEGIGDWIAQDNPGGAVSFVLELRKICERLAAAPRAFPLLPGHESSGVRPRTYGSYLVF